VIWVGEKTDNERKVIRVLVPHQNAHVPVSVLLVVYMDHFKQERTCFNLKRHILGK